MGDNITYKRNDKTMHIVERFYSFRIVKPILPIVSKTFITPNMITILNMLFSFIVLYAAFNKYYVFCAIGIQIYLFLDILDGNLARYKNMKSELGAKLDALCDNFFYNFILVCLGVGRVSYITIILSIVLLNLYGLIATNYIVPNLKKLKLVKRRGIKKFFMDKGYIIGMDLGTVDIIMSLSLVLLNVSVMFKILIIGFVLDILWRIYELKFNQRLSINKES